MNSLVLAALVALLSVVIGIALAGFTKPLSTDICFFDSDCGWKVTSCCPANAGGTWSCVNARTFQKPVCNKFILCPQVMAPQPDAGCACRNLKCSAG